MKKQSEFQIKLLSGIVPETNKLKNSTNNAKKIGLFFLLLFSLSFSRTFAQVGTFTGWGMSVCNQFPFTICPGQVITPSDYGSQPYSCDGVTMDDVAFTVAPPGYRVAKHNWNFTANVGGQVTGVDNLGATLTTSFIAGDVIIPVSYATIGANTFVTLSVGGNSVQLDQLSFQISINAATFTGNTYTYCPNTSQNLAISVTEPIIGGPWTYNWTPGGMTGNPINVSPIVNTTYIATATSQAGCTSTVAVAVTITCTPTGCCIGNNCADIIKNPLISDWQVPLGNFNYVFNRGANKTGKVGIGNIGGCSPGNLLEVKKGTTSNISGLRLTDLASAAPLAANNKVLSIDASGDVILVSANTSGITNACATTNFIPKTTTGGNLICSQIFDNATSVGIGATGPFNYTSLSVVGVTSVPSTGTVRLFVNGVTKASAYFATSDQRFKKQITSIENASEIIKKLEGKSYYWKSEEFKDHGFNTTKQFGFIAQELEKVIPEAVATDENGYKSVNYDMIIPILVQGSKEQALVIDNLQKQIDELKNLIKSLATTISTDNTKNTNSQAVNLSDKNTIVLNQNVPNPFAESTVIDYNIPSDFTKAQIIFTTIDGKIIKAIDINVKGNGTLNVFANDLTSGLYSYSLIVDSKVIDTKKMVKE